MTHSNSEYTCKMENVSKSFGNITAVDNIEFKVRKGEIFCLVGPNGAGKTTAIKVLLGILASNKGSGKITILNKSIPKQRKQVMRQVGYLPQSRALYPLLTVRENIEFFGTIKGMEKNDLRERSAELLEKLDLVDLEDRKAQDLSGGQQQKTALAAALVHQPEVLVLDEPTVGLDPLLREDLWKYWKQEIKKHNSSLLLSTHYLRESDFADRVAIMREGKIVGVDSPSALKKQCDAVTMDEVFIKMVRDKNGENSS